MQRKLLVQLDAEIATVCRVHKLAEQQVVHSLIEWMDYEFHGIVPLPLDEKNVPLPAKPGKD